MLDLRKPPVLGGGGGFGRGCKMHMKQPQIQSEWQLSGQSGLAHKIITTSRALATRHGYFLKFRCMSTCTCIVVGYSMLSHVNRFTFASFFHATGADDVCEEHDVLCHHDHGFVGL